MSTPDRPPDRSAVGTVDAYCHCGISKYRPVQDVSALMALLGISRAVLVQHLGEFDNGYLQQVVAAEPRRFRAVALLDHEGDYEPGLGDLARAAEFAAVRVPEAALLAAGHFAADVVDAGIAVVVDLPSGVAGALDQVAALAERRRDVPIVLSHLGYPQSAGGAVPDPGPLLSLVGQENVHVLLSGFSEVASSPYEELRDFVGSVIDAFGPGRMMWGSDYPVAGDAQACAADREFARSLVEDGAAHRLVFGGTATRVFFGGDS